MNTLLDEKIDYKEREIRALDDQRVSLAADVKSREMSGGAFAAGDEKQKLVSADVAKGELARAERALMLSQGQLLILQYLRDQRNALYARHSLVLSNDTLSVAELLENYPVPERLVQDICQRVQPSSWSRPGVRISIAPDGTLSLTQSRDVILGVRDYVEKLKDAQEARKRAKQ